MKTKHIILTMAIALLVMGMDCDPPNKCEEMLEEGDWAGIKDECNPEDMEAAQLVTAGKIGLQNCEPDNAVVYFESVEPASSIYGSARYAILLADFQKLAGEIESLTGLADILGNIGGPSSAPLVPQQATDLWGIVGGYLDGAADVSRLLQEKAQEVVSNGWTIEIDDFPFIIGEETQDVFVEVFIDGQNGELAARVIWMSADLIVAVVDYLAAHAWMISLSDLIEHMEDLTGVDLENTDLLDLVRSFAWLPQENPDFFQKSTRWNDSMTDIQNIVSTGAENIKALDTAIAATAVSGSSDCNRAMCLVDLDSSGTISAGDQFLLRGSVHVALGAGLFALAGGLTSDTISQINDVAAVLDDYGIDISASAAAGMVIDIDLTSTEVLGTTAMLTSMLAGALPALETLLDIVVDSLGGTDVVEATDINPVLTALGLPAVPNVLSLDLSKFMDMPIGDLMGYYCVNANDQPVTCGTGTTPVFPLEVEMLSVSTRCAALGICGSAPYPPYYMEGDNAHFAGTSFAFDADGLAPVDAGAAALSTDILLYVAMPDPTMNGALKLDLATLPAVCGGTETASGFTPATLQGGNIVVNCLILDYLPKLEASTFYTDVYPLIEPFVAMLGL